MFRIVTGVAITKRNRMIQFVIGESTLLPYGKLNTTITAETGDSNANNRYVGHPEFSIDSKGVHNGVDYHSLTYDKRSINLDSVECTSGKYDTLNHSFIANQFPIRKFHQIPFSRVVTGIRFHAFDNGVLAIQIRCTEFDYEQGVCYQNVNRTMNDNLLNHWIFRSIEKSRQEYLDK